MTKREARTTAMSTKRASYEKYEEPRKSTAHRLVSTSGCSTCKHQPKQHPKTYLLPNTKGPVRAACQEDVGVEGRVMDVVHGSLSNRHKSWLRHIDSKDRGVKNGVEAWSQSAYKRELSRLARTECSSHQCGHCVPKSGNRELSERWTHRMYHWMIFEQSPPSACNVHHGQSSSQQTAPGLRWSTCGCCRPRCQPGTCRGRTSGLAGLRG